MTAFLDQYEHILHFVAELLAYTLELVGILIIVVGSFRALVRLIRNFRSRGQFNVVIDLGRALALALEFKMGAEIIKTVIIHDIMELITLAIVILIRALLAVIIHWEIKMERREEITKSLDDITALSQSKTTKK
jgi:uncharacterized membrane protein